MLNKKRDRVEFEKKSAFEVMMTSNSKAAQNPKNKNKKLKLTEDRHQKTINFNFGGVGPDVKTAKHMRDFEQAESLFTNIGKSTDSSDLPNTVKKDTKKFVVARGESKKVSNRNSDVVPEELPEETSQTTETLVTTKEPRSKSVSFKVDEEEVENSDTEIMSEADPKLEDITSENFFTVPLMKAKIIYPNKEMKNKKFTDLVTREPMDAKE